MVDTSLLIAIVGITGTILASIIGGYVNLQTTRIQQMHSNRRTIADYYMEKKIRYLIDLYEETSKLSGGFVQYVLYSRDDSNFSVSESEYYEFKKQINDFSEQVDRCMIFLDNEKYHLAVKCSLICKIVLSNTHKQEDGYVIDWLSAEADFNNIYEEIELDAFRKHTRLVEEMIDEELNKPINTIYEPGDNNNNTYKKELYDKITSFYPSNINIR